MILIKAITVVVDVVVAIVTLLVVADHITLSFGQEMSFSFKTSSTKLRLQLMPLKPNIQCLPKRGNLSKPWYATG